MSDDIEPIYRLIAAKIEHLRTMLDWTQDELSKRVGVSRAQIANIEAGRSRVMLHQVEKFATAFQTTPKNFLKGIWT